MALVLDVQDVRRGDDASRWASRRGTNGSELRRDGHGRTSRSPILRSLVERGLDVSQLLVIVDGGKGLRAAVRKAFRHRAVVQRCRGMVVEA